MNEPQTPTWNASRAITTSICQNTITRQVILQLADIVSEANRITGELYANYESLVRAANEICKPFADQGVMPETLNRMVEFLTHINAECSTLGSNFSASVNDVSRCDAASTLSNQRVSALVRQLVTDGSVERSEERRLAYFEAVD